MSMDLRLPDQHYQKANEQEERHVHSERRPWHDVGLEAWKGRKEWFRKDGKTGEI
jgi:hypothetical protein